MIGHLYSIDDPQVSLHAGRDAGRSSFGNSSRSTSTATIFADAGSHSWRPEAFFETHLLVRHRKDFAEALAERARAGVKVRVPLDWLGSSKMDKAYLATMEQAGVESASFTNPLV